MAFCNYGELLLQLCPFLLCNKYIGKKGIKGFASDIKNAINLKIGVKVQIRQLHND